MQRQTGFWRLIHGLSKVIHELLESIAAEHQIIKKKYRAVGYGTFTPDSLVNVLNRPIWFLT